MARKNSGFMYNTLFPDEVWKSILSYLKFRDLLCWRLVNHEFKLLADEVLLETSSLWRPTFPTNFEDYLKQVSGTKFSRVQHVTTFLTEMEGCTLNPFPNQTVIFAPVVYQSRIVDTNPLTVRRFYESFKPLVTRYGKEIRSLVYFFSEVDDSIEYIHQMLDICKLPNLTSLVIYRSTWNIKSSFRTGNLLAELVKCGGFPIPKKMTELQIWGEMGFMPLYSLFCLMQPVMQSLTHLQCSYSSVFEGSSNNPDVELGKEKLKLMLRNPNLKRLKLWDPYSFPVDCYMLPMEGRRASELKEIGLKFPLDGQPQPVIMQMGECLANVLNAMDLHSESLELFTFDIDEKILKEYPEPELDPPWNSGIVYPKMRKLITTFFTVLQWSTLMEEFKRRFVNLEELTLHLALMDVQGRPAQVFYEFSNKIWGRMPPSLKVMRVPIFGWELKRGQVLSFE